MDTTTKNMVRFGVLIALAATAMVGIFAEPAEDSAHWAAEFLASKSIGILAALTGSRLAGRWDREERR